MTEAPRIEVEGRHREAAARALGYKDWGDATDYRLTGKQDREVTQLVQAFATFEAAHLASLDAVTRERDELRTAWNAMRDLWQSSEQRLAIAEEHLRRILDGSNLMERRMARDFLTKLKDTPENG